MQTSSLFIDPMESYVFENKVNKLIISEVSVENIKTLREACDLKGHVEQSLADTLHQYQKQNPFLNTDTDNPFSNDQIVDNIIMHHKKIFELTEFINFVSMETLTTI